MFPGVWRWLYAHASFTPVKGKACVLVGGLGGREEKARSGEKERRRERERGKKIDAGYLCLIIFNKTGHQCVLRIYCLFGK